MPPSDMPAYPARSTPTESSSASTPAPRPAIVYGPGQAAAAPWPGSSNRSNRKLRRRSGTCRSHTAVLVPREFPSISTGASWRRVELRRHSATGQACQSDIEEDGLVLALQVDVEPEIARSAVGRPGDQRVPADRDQPTAAPGRPRWPSPRPGSRSGSRPGPAVRARTPRHRGAAPRCRRPGRQRAGPQRDDLVPPVGIGGAAAEAAEAVDRGPGRPARIVWMVEPRVRVGLPGLDERVRQRLARPRPGRCR